MVMRVIPSSQSAIPYGVLLEINEKHSRFSHVSGDPVSVAGPSLRSCRARPTVPQLF